MVPGAGGHTAGGSPMVCGDGVVAGCEECDDGNNVPGDGCDENCFVSGCAGACAQDTDFNGLVDAADLAELLACWGNPHGPGVFCACLDVEPDGDIDAADLAELLIRWGTCP